MFGLGDSVYQDNYNVIGSQIDMWMAELAAVRVHDFTCGDENTAKSLHAGQRQDFLAWPVAVFFTRFRPFLPPCVCSCTLVERTIALAGRRCNIVPSVAGGIQVSKN